MSWPVEPGAILAAGRWLNRAQVESRPSRCYLPYRAAGWNAARVFVALDLVAPADPLTLDFPSVAAPLIHRVVFADGLATGHANLNPDGSPSAMTATSLVWSWARPCCLSWDFDSILYGYEIRRGRLGELALVLDDQSRRELEELERLERLAGRPTIDSPDLAAAGRFSSAAGAARTSSP